MKGSICVVTAGHLATTPRMVKVANALADEGYRVSVVSTRFMEWADSADRDVFASRHANWSWTSVDYRRNGSFPLYALSGLRFRLARRVTRAMTVGRAPRYISARARDRVFPELTAAIVATKPDMIYGGGNALAATAAAARRARVPFALDLEDYHSAQDPAGPFAGLTERIERDILPRAALLTGGSRAIAAAYEQHYGVNVLPIHNVFPLPSRAPEITAGTGPLRLYWFGQTVGPGRGIEDAIAAIGLACIPAELSLRGSVSEEYLALLSGSAAIVAPLLQLTLLQPASPDEMIELCRPYDVGIALERPERYSQELALTNKALSYVLAGLAVAMTDTGGQHEFGTDLGEGGLVCKAGDLKSLADGLARWSGDREALLRARQSAWAAARARWHWEHPDERGKLLAAVDDVFANQAGRAGTANRRGPLD